MKQNGAYGEGELPGVLNCSTSLLVARKAIVQRACLHYIPKCPSRQGFLAGDSATMNILMPLEHTGYACGWNRCAIPQLKNVDSLYAADIIGHESGRTQRVGRRR